MIPEFEKVKIFGDEIVCSLMSGGRVSSFNFIYDDNNSLTLDSNLKIYFKNIEHTRRCQLIKNSNDELYLKFRKINLSDLNEECICQPFFRAESFTCLSCNNKFSKDNTSPCCSFDNNIIKINKAKIYKICFLNYQDYFSNYSASRNDFKLLHFATVIDTMLLSDPI